MSARVVVADGSVATRAGLRLALTRGGMTVTGEAGHLGQLLADPTLAQADLVVIGLDLPGGGLPAVEEVVRRRPGVRVLALTAAQTDDEMMDALVAGAAGYLPRGVAAERLPVIAAAVVRGEAALPRNLSGRLLDELRNRHRTRVALRPDLRASLSPREWDVLEQIADGRRTSEIALDLGISDVTVRRHISSLFAKLGVRDRAGLAALLKRDERPG